jgi:hypothetical protein
MQVRHREVFTSIKTEGAILPPDLLQRIFSGDRDLDGLRSEDYHLPGGEKLNEAINRSWNILQGYWRSFQNGMEKLSEGDLGTTLVRERWLLPLFQELGYGRLLTHKAIEIEKKTYPISHSWHKTPIHLVGCKVDLDRRMAGVAGAARSSPHSLVQELLNRSDDHLWAFLSNGLRLRILRDNLSLTRQAYVEFDLETMMEGEIYSDFVLLWLVCHQSRVEADKPEESWLEKWSKTAQEKGTRALDQLRDGVEDAIKALGSGFLKNPLNWALREKLKAGQLDKQDYYRQILRLIYRLLFLFVAEDRDMLFDPDSKTEAREFYIQHYSTTRLRRMAEKFRGTRHSDLYQGFRLVSEKLGDHGCPELGLPALGSFIFSKNKALPDLENSEISNEDFLNAIRALTFTLDQGVLRAVDYKNLGSEEFGSVYESLLELHPDLNTDTGTFELEIAGGHERKTTGSYYTPTGLVQCLLDSALDPVLNEAANKPDPENAILDLKICDPACGSGHFLIAAAHRVARRLGAIRTGDEEPAPEATRAALRDVISNCIYGVDLNPMAVELCKVALWMESLDPGKPLSFLDHKIQCGNSLLGTTPKLLAEGIPNEAFKPIEGDDPKYCSVLRRRNEQERQGQMTMCASMVAESHAEYGSLSDRYRSFVEMGDATVKAVTEKEKQYDLLLKSSNYQHSKLIADAWCAAFVWPKRTDAPGPVTQDIFRKIQSLDLQPIGETIAEVYELSEKYRFFHWHLAFPDVFRVPSNGESAENDQTGWNGGFSVILGNPPWEKIEILQREWFSDSILDLITVQAWKEKNEVLNQLKASDYSRYRYFEDSYRKANSLRAFIRRSDMYPLCGRERINSYSAFAEIGLKIIFLKGYVGFVLPPGIATDDSTKDFIQHLVKNEYLKSFFAFTNRGYIFPEIESTLSFSLITYGSRKHDKLQVAAQLWKIEHLRDEDRVYTLDRAVIARINPNTLNLPILKSSRDARVVDNIHKRISVLQYDKGIGESDWDIEFKQGLFNMTSDKKEFKTFEQLQSLNFKLKGNIFVNNDDTYLPLYEAKLTSQYNHRHGTFENVSVSERFGTRAQTNKPSSVNLFDPHWNVLPRYWTNKDLTLEKIPENWKRKWFLGFRNAISAVADSRSIAFVIIPRVAVGNSLPLLFCYDDPISSAILLANFNSFVLDYIGRQKACGGNLNFYVVKQLAILPLNTYVEPCPWSSKNPQKKDTELTLKDWILSNTIELIYTAWDLSDFAKDCGYIGPPFRWDEERRFLLRCELDGAFFILYRIENSDVNYIMDTFPIIKRKDLQKYGEYRTKLTILDIYDRMQQAIESGEPYQTLIDPAPTDPSVAHLPKDGGRQPGSLWHLNDLLHSMPAENIIHVQIPDEYLFECIDSSGLAKFRILKEGERMTRECQVVIIRHPELKRGAEKVKIAAGKFYWAEQRDVETGKPFILITLRTKGVPARLKLSEEEWKQFRPLAILEE